MATLATAGTLESKMAGVVTEMSVAGNGQGWWGQVYNHGEGFDSHLTLRPDSLPSSTLISLSLPQVCFTEQPDWRS